MTLKQREFVQAAIVIGQAPARIVSTQILPTPVAHHRRPRSWWQPPFSRSPAVLPGAGRRNEMSGASCDRRGPHHDPRSLVDERVWPGVAILLTVLAINLIGEGLNDALNPQLRKRGE